MQWGDWTVGNFYFDGSAAQFRFEVVGKNAGSSDYDIYIDKIMLIPGL